MNMPVITIPGKSKERNQSVELLRLLMMTLIVFGHIIGHSNKEIGDMPSRYLYPLYFYHVDTFIFISGYYGIKLRWTKLGLLLAKMLIYSLVAVGLTALLSDDIRIGITELVKNVYPISACDWWFMSQYLFLMLLAPVLNAGMDALDEKQSTVIVMLLYLSWFRCTYVLVVFIYVLGRHLSKYPIPMLERHAGFIFTATVVTFFALNLFLTDWNLHPKKLYDYMSPFAVIPAVSLFFFFKKRCWHWKGIGFVSAGVLAAYLITDHELLRPLFCTIMYKIANGNCVLIVFISFVVVVACSLIDVVVTKLLKPLFSFTNNKVSQPTV